MNKELEEKLCNSVEQTLENIITDGEIREEDVKFVGELVDIKKDLANMEYWEAKEETMDMRYMGRGRGSYGTYGRDSYGARRRDSRGRYMEGGNGNYGNDYGRRYKGHDMIDEMSEHYGNYSENRQRYGTDNETMKSLEYMLQSVEDFMYMLKEDAESQQEVEMIKQTARRISEM